MKQQIQIAIDGPVAAGKGTIAHRLAEHLKILYVDTGAMYRSVAYMGLQKKIDLQDAHALLVQLKITPLRYCADYSGLADIYIGSECVTDHIRTQKVSDAASIVAQHPEIRSYLVSVQRDTARGHSVVMEGRDIGTVVLPTATHKIFLTADQKTRARRRYAQLQEKGINTTFEEVLEETKKRDKRDTTRDADPLIPAPDAIRVDTSNLTIEEVVKTIKKHITS